MAERTVKQLKVRRDAAIARRQNWEGSWRDAYRFALPQRDIMDQPKPGQPKGDLVFDSTAINSLTAFANKITDAMFPPFQDFISLEPGPAIGEENDQQARKLLEEVSKVFHAAIHRSNFDVAIGEFLLDLAVGTGVMMFLPGNENNPFNFVPVALPIVALEPGKWNSVGGIYRDHKVTVEQMEAQWPDINIPEDWKKKSNDKPDEEYEIHDATYFDDATEVWYYDVWRDEAETSMLDAVRKYDGAGPWITTRWAKAANEVYGRGPLLFALPDIRTANRVVELILKNASLAVGGIWTGISDGVFNPNTARFTPGSVIPVARNQGHPMGASLAPLERAASFDVGELILQDLRFNIKRALFDEDLPPETGAVRSPTEIVARLKRLASNTGPAFGRLKDELMVPITIRGLQILDKMELINFPVVIDGTTIKVNVVSPLAQQQSLNDVQNTVQAIELTTATAGQEMTALSFKIEELGEYFAKKLNVDPNLVRDETEREDLQQMVAQLIAQAQQQAQGEGEGGEGQPPAEGGNVVQGQFG